MFKFKEKVIFTGKKSMVSKQGRDYTIVNYLGDDGNTFGTVADCLIPDSIKQLDEVEVTFGVIPGRYVQLKTIDIQKINIQK